jgi:hypothetical protein
LDESQKTSLWERQSIDGILEPQKWFNRFTVYMLQGPGRSLLAVVNEEREQKGHKRSVNVPGSWRRIFAVWQWKDRAAAWDERNRQLMVADAEAERVQMLDRHRKMGQALQQVAGIRLRELATNPNELSPVNVKDYIKTGVELERQAAGFPTWVIDLIGLTDEELVEQYIELTESLSTIAGDTGDSEAT